MSEDSNLKSEDELIRKKLNFFKEEFISIKESKEEDQLSTVIANFRDLIDKINFSDRKQGMINIDIDFLTSFIFNPYRNDDGSLTDNQKIDLEKKGHKFKSNSDTEVIIYAYKKWGYNCVEFLNGMWAFAIYDKGKNKLFCPHRIQKPPGHFWYQKRRRSPPSCLHPR